MVFHLVGLSGPFGAGGRFFSPSEPSRRSQCYQNIKELGFRFLGPRTIFIGILSLFGRLIKFDRAVASRKLIIHFSH